MFTLFYTISTRRTHGDAPPLAKAIAGQMYFDLAEAKEEAERLEAELECELEVRTWEAREAKEAEGK